MNGRGGTARGVKRKSERKAVLYIYIHQDSRYIHTYKVGRRGMKRGDFPSAVYVAFLLPSSGAAAIRKPAESGPKRARRVLITNNYEC